MDRDAHWFPPDDDDLRKPMAALTDASKDLDSAVRAIGQLSKYVSEFPLMGSKTAQRKLLDALSAYTSDLKDHQASIARMLRSHGQLASLIRDAFHSPAEAGERVSIPDGFDGLPVTASYRYDRR